MSNRDLEGDIARLERYVGSTGVDIHNFDDPEQAAAHAKQLEADAKAEEKLQAKQAAEAEKEA